MFTKTLDVKFKDKMHKVVLVLQRFGITEEAVYIFSMVNEINIENRVLFTNKVHARSFITNFSLTAAKEFLENESKGI